MEANKPEDLQLSMCIRQAVEHSMCIRDCLFQVHATRGRRFPRHPSNDCKLYSEFILCHVQFAFCNLS